jgi:hypothetical protein
VVVRCAECQARRVRERVSGTERGRVCVRHGWRYVGVRRGCAVRECLARRALAGGARAVRAYACVWHGAQAVRGARVCQARRVRERVSDVVRVGGAGIRECLARNAGVARVCLTPSS